jgi:hypothetical protein
MWSQWHVEISLWGASKHGHDFISFQISDQRRCRPGRYIDDEKQLAAGLPSFLSPFSKYFLKYVTDGKISGNGPMT